jgi:hypothetical protein
MSAGIGSAGSWLIARRAALPGDDGEELIKRLGATIDWGRRRARVLGQDRSFDSGAELGRLRDPPGGPEAHPQRRRITS